VKTLHSFSKGSAVVSLIIRILGLFLGQSDVNFVPGVDSTAVIGCHYTHIYLMLFF
jgi:hypothetical protein